MTTTLNQNDVEAARGLLTTAAAFVRDARGDIDLASEYLAGHQSAAELRDLARQAGDLIERIAAVRSKLEV